MKGKVEPDCTRAGAGVPPIGVAGVIGDGIQWLVEQRPWQHSVVFARAIGAEELAVRMGGRPGGIPSPASAELPDQLTGRATIRGTFRMNSSGVTAVAVVKRPNARRMPPSSAKRPITAAPRGMAPKLKRRDAAP